MQHSRFSLIIFIIVGLLICLVTQHSFAQLGFRVNYDYVKPTGQMGNAIQEIHGFNFEGLYHIKKTPFTLGVDLGYGRYGAHQDFNQPIVFNNRTIVPQDLYVRSERLSFMLTGKIDLYPQAVIQPYLNTKVGWQLFYSYFLVDGLSRSNREIIRDYSFTGGVGAGAKISLSRIFDWRLDAFKNVFINLEANYLLGSEVSFMSVNPPNDATQAVSNNGFGNIYSTLNQATEIKVGIGFGF